MDGIPVDIYDEVRIDTMKDYHKFLTRYTSCQIYHERLRQMRSYSTKNMLPPV